MSILNTEIKPFTATAYKKGEKDYVTVSDTDLRGQWSVLFFYPADFTFVCPTELGDMADLYADFKALGVEIYGVSTDTHHVHKAWADAGRVLDAIVKNIHKSLVSGSDVRISNLGVFDTAERAEREGRNPATGATIKIAASKAVRFRVSKPLKDAVNG